MKPDLLTRFEFGKKAYVEDTTIVEISADNKDAMILVKESTDDENQGRTFFLEPDEIDLFISVLTLYKNKILNPKRRNDDEE